MPVVSTYEDMRKGAFIGGASIPTESESDMERDDEMKKEENEEGEDMSLKGTD